MVYLGLQPTTNSKILYNRRQRAKCGEKTFPLVPETDVSKPQFRCIRCFKLSAQQCLFEVLMEYHVYVWCRNPRMFIYLNKGWLLCNIYARTLTFLFFRVILGVHVFATSSETRLAILRPNSLRKRKDGGVSRNVLSIHRSQPQGQTDIWR